MATLNGSRIPTGFVHSVDQLPEPKAISPGSNDGRSAVSEKARRRSRPEPCWGQTDGRDLLRLLGGNLQDRDTILPQFVTGSFKSKTCRANCARACGPSATNIRDQSGRHARPTVHATLVFTLPSGAWASSSWRGAHSNREHIQHSSNCDRERADHFVSVPSCLRSLPKHSDARRAIETKAASQARRSTENLAIRAGWPYIFGDIARVA